MKAAVNHEPAVAERARPPSRAPALPARSAAARLPADADVAQARRQGDPAQEPEPDLLPDQRRRARGGAHGRGPAAAGRASTGSTRTTATARCASRWA